MTLTLLQKSAMAIALAGVGLTCLHTDSAQAALLHYSFTTEQDGTGSFLLDTDTPISPDIPALLFDADNNVTAEGIYYAGAVSSFTFSSPGAGSFLYPNLDLVVFPDVQTTSSTVLAGIGTLECSLPTNTCPLQLSVDYQGSLAALPGLSSNPDDYFLYSVAGYPKGDITFNELIKSSNAVAVPEPTVVSGMLAAGAIGGVLHKRLRLRQKRA